jgi:small-conductance mechanosensitive channel
MFNFIDQFNGNLFLKVCFTVISVTILYWIFCYIFNFLKKFLLGKAKNKKERSDIEIFSKAIKYIVVLFLIIFGVLSYSGSLVSIGLFAGLISASFGFSLQRPISGMAAWLMVVVKRPFEIGDRVIIGTVKGDVSDISLSHIHIKEIGGTIPSEETSGRSILIPNAKLFEEDIINYTRKDNFILDEVSFPITFDSDIDIAQKIAEESAEIVLKGYEKNKQKPYSRTYFQPSGVDVFVRYLTLASNRNEISSKITQNIFKKVNKNNKIKFAYFHSQVFLNNTQNEK